MSVLSPGRIAALVERQKGKERKQPKTRVGLTAASLFYFNTS